MVLFLFESSEGVDKNDWGGVYGVNANGGELTVKFVTEGEYATNVGSVNNRINPLNLIKSFNNYTIL